MPAGWLHQTLDFIAYGRAYRCVHQKKDEAAQRIPGLRHREFGHDRYHTFGILWDLSDPFREPWKEEIRRVRAFEGPDAAEQQMASDAHDFLDRAWDVLPKPRRVYSEGFFLWLLYQPDLLESWAGVDVIRGRILRRIDGEDVWEGSPETIWEYKRLRREVSRHQKWRLREVLARYG